MTIHYLKLSIFTYFIAVQVLRSIVVCAPQTSPLGGLPIYNELWEAFFIHFKHF